jgi:hypothetical protein
MQFKHPELLWALFLLLIPIIIHLFQLRRFKKTPFTNVAMLQKVISESRKSNNLKKWLLLLTRLMLLACIIIAFAQPFFAKSTALQEKEMVIYLDDSFSMQAQKDGFTLLEQAVQDLVKTVPSDSKFSLFTNNHTFKDVELKNVQNELLSLDYKSNQLSFNEVVLKAKTLFSRSVATQKNLILISDFQERKQNVLQDSIKDLAIHLVNLKPDNTNNISIDSLYFNNAAKNQIELNIEVSGIPEDETVPISIYNDNRLIAKTAAAYNSTKKTTTTLSLPKNEVIKGRVTLSDNGLVYDNNFYFNIDEKDKIKVLVISESDAGFLNRIFTQEEFEFENLNLKNLNYSEIDKQNLVIVNGISAIPSSLQAILKQFHQKGGSIVIIPSLNPDIGTYNLFLSNLTSTKFTARIEQEQKITSIAFDHPLFENVFEKRVSNFDYPNAKTYWSITTNSPQLLSFANNAPFLIGNSNVFVFTASLNNENSNFKNAPLIVPTFYNIGINSLKNPELYATIGENTVIDVSKNIEKDHVLKVVKTGIEFIPLQQSFSNKVRLTFLDNPNTDGIYSLIDANDTLRNLSFNYQRKESVLRYQNMDDFIVSTIQNDIPEVFENMAKDNSITQYWKWFIIFALVFALVEVLIQKFLA